MLALWQNYFQSKSAHLQETVVKVMHENQRTDSNGEIVSLISYHNLFHYSCMKKKCKETIQMNLYGSYGDQRLKVLTKRQVAYD